MINEIGELSGTVWQKLNEKGPMTVTQLKNLLKTDDFILAAAIGWLAREDKLVLKKSGKSIKTSLK